MLVSALAEGRVKELSREQPELFLCEVKNKTDRYDSSKLEDKTRPYINFPYHISVLCSFLSQAYTKSLQTADQAGHNAYGITMSGGKMNKVLEKVRAMKELGSAGGEPVYYAYGDDVDIFYRRKGKVYRISPDFRQMDGSVDKATVKAVVRMVLKAFEAEHGPNAFWKAVGDLWVEMALNPRFLVHGTMSYRKPGSDGLMTGVVGTTLFDTAKAVLAVTRYVEELHAYKRFELLGEKQATVFFKNLGLEVKAGTWKPEVAQVEPLAGALVGRNKFLGVRWRWAQGPQRTEVVPDLDFEEWIRLLAVPRDDPAELKRKGGGGGAVSDLQMQRRLYDRARGLLVTGAVFNPHMEQVLGGVVDGLSAGGGGR